MCNDDKMSKGFHITSVCRNDIIEMMNDCMDDRDELKKLMLAKGVENITDEEMKGIASGISDDFGDCCFWDNLEYRFGNLMREKHDIKKI